MTSRRDFVKSASLLSAALFIKPSLLKYDKSLIGLQLYTVRDAMAKDPAATLAKVAQLGFNSVEGASYTGTQNFYGMDAAAFKAVLHQNGNSSSCLSPKPCSGCFEALRCSGLRTVCILLHELYLLRNDGGMSSPSAPTLLVLRVSPDFQI